MQFLTVLLACASVAHAHYNFPALQYAGTTQAAWQQGTDIRPRLAYLIAAMLTKPLQ